MNSNCLYDLRRPDSRQKHTHDYAPLFLCLALLLCWGILHFLTGISFLGPSVYKSYTLQALAWREGQLHLPAECGRMGLELAIFKDQFYVSFPPLPSVILFPLTFIFGENTPDNLLVKIYTLAVCLMIYYSLKRAGYGRAVSALFAFCLCMASSMLPLTLEGAVWYHAQVLGFAAVMAAFFFFSRGRMTEALLCYALSVACRPFDALYAVPIFFCYFSIQKRSQVSFGKSLKPLLPGIFSGLCVAALLALYNYLRFGNPLEFGHNYLPEFSTEGGTQFSLSHVLPNLKTFLWGLPFSNPFQGEWNLNAFGFSLLLACPMITLTLVSVFLDLITRRFSREKAIVVMTMIVHLFLLLTHRTFGGYQIGARYAVDVIPYCFLYLLLSRPRHAWNKVQIILCIPVFLFICYAVTEIHI